MLAVVSAFALGAAFPSGTLPGMSDQVTYHSQICACKNTDGVCYEAIAEGPCKHNTLTSGKEAIELYLRTGGAKAAFDQLALSNCSVDYPTAGDTNFTCELTGGLARGAATVYDMGTGNWSLVKTWTAGATFFSVNTTGIFNSSTAGAIAYFAGGTFTSVNLESADTLTINYTLWIS